MKKISIILLAALFASTAASAKDGFYIGADILQAKAKHNYISKYYFVQHDKNSFATSTGFALDAGYKFNLDKAFIAPEIFYDKLNNSANDFYYDDVPFQHQDRMNVTHRQGAKINFGYNIRPKFAVFVNAGAARVRYNVEWASTGQKYSSATLAPIYGIGASYDINDKLALRISHDRQRFNIRWVLEGLRSEVNLDVTKLGMVYSF